MTNANDPEFWLDKNNQSFTRTDNVPVAPGSEQAVTERLAELEVSQLLLNLRERAGLTQAQLAKRLNRSRPAITQAEKRPLKNCSIGLVTEIAAACGYSFDPTKALEPLD